MDVAIASPPNATVLGIPSIFFSILIPLVGLSLLLYILWKRWVPLSLAAPDFRKDRIRERLVRTYLYPHHRMPRYRLVSVIHITILAGFILLAIRWITLPLLGIWEGVALPGFGRVIGDIYTDVKDFAATLVFIACVFAIVRRAFFKPERYRVPPRHGKDRSWTTIAALSAVASLMLADMFFQGSLLASQTGKGLETGMLIPGTGVWLVKGILSTADFKTLQRIHLGSYYFHELLFFSFLCFLPFTRFFHFMTSLPTLFSMKLDKGSVKPVRWGISEEQIEALDSFGVKKMQDFTWKHMLDFYSCADCGRCSDQCPANAVGRPLSPRFISIKCRDFCYAAYPVWNGAAASNETPLIGKVLEEDEIWSCTTCGACEEECPLLIEYIDKIVDLRRGMVDDGMVPQSLQKPLQSLEKRGNPFGIMEKKRADWTQTLPEGFPIVLIGKNESEADSLFFVDSITSYDESVQQIARSTAVLLHALGIPFGILGPAEKDSGHEVRRFGEEMLFWKLRDSNTEAILNAGIRRIVTSDPHAYNALKHDYSGIPAVEHISQVLARHVDAGKLRLKRVENPDAIYTYHDACYLGRHNGLYDVPRRVIDAIPGIRRVEMKRCRDRSFCCGGGGLMLYYEAPEEKRMGQVRVEMAESIGADIIVTACPFCRINIEDAIKTSGLEGKMEVIDLVQLVERHLE